MELPGETLILKALNLNSKIKNTPIPQNIENEEFIDKLANFGIIKEKDKIIYGIGRLVQLLQNGTMNKENFLSNLINTANKYEQFINEIKIKQK